MLGRRGSFKEEEFMLEFYFKSNFCFFILLRESLKLALYYLVSTFYFGLSIGANKTVV